MIGENIGRAHPQADRAGHEPSPGGLGHSVAIPCAGDACAFLNKAALYFERRPTGGEDSAHWANVQNALNCRKAMNLIDDLTDGLALAVEIMDDQLCGDFPEAFAAFRDLLATARSGK